MKIGQLAIKNFLGIRQFNSSLGELNLICGLNGSGKSSVENAIRLAVIGQVSRVSLKKDFSLLIHEGQKQAQIQIEGDPDSTLTITASKNTGIPNADDAPPVLQLLLNMHSFSGMDATELRKALFAISGIGTDDAEIMKRLEEAEADMRRVESIRPLLRNFEAAEKEAEGKVKEARGEWKGITGETYGEVKAESWEADVPAVVKVKDRSAELRAAVQAANKALAEQKAGKGMRVQIERDLEAARAKGKEYSRHADAMAPIDKDIETAKATIAELENVLAGGPAIKAVGTAPCPECGSDLMILPGNKLIGRGEYESQQASSPSADVKLKLGEQKKALEFLERARANRKRDLDAADTAAKQVPAYEKQLEDLAKSSDAEDEATLQAAFDDADTAYRAHVDELGSVASSELAAKRAVEKTKDAAGAHASAKAWHKIKQLMSPDGIPSQFLNGVLDQLNRRLLASAKETGWGQVQIHADMHITYAGRLLQLCSESERWRADAQLCEAVAYVSAECFLMFDRVDVLGAEQRGVLLGWCDQLVQEGHQVVLFSTLKGPPAVEGVNVVWLERGEIKEAA